jgi:1,4-alpha-glucan branching enzyme
MNDSLEYMTKEPVHRRFHQNDITFSLIYAFHENFILVLSHDEVVHGKRSLQDKMPGDRWQKFANLRMFYAWMYGHPGKKLLFMGSEFGQTREWDHANSLDWHLLQYGEHEGVQRLTRDLNRIYRSEPSLFTLDDTHEGFEWIDFHDAENSVVSFLRKGSDGSRIIFIVNATPVVRYDYRVGLPEPGFYQEILNSDASIYGGSDVGNYPGRNSEAINCQGRDHSALFNLPPLATMAFKWMGQG